MELGVAEERREQRSRRSRELRGRLGEIGGRSGWMVTCVGLGEAKERREQRRFACARAADDADERARRDAEADL